MTTVKKKIINKNRRFELFNDYIVRIPMFSIDELNNLHKADDFFGALLNLSQDPFIKEALIIASPSLYNRLETIDKEVAFDSKETKILLSFYKYYSRMCLRPTPFGLFSGLCSGYFSDDDNIMFDQTKFYKKNVKIEYQVLEKLKERFGSTELQSGIRLHANSSIYNFQNSLRFTVMKEKEGKKSFSVEAVSISDHLMLVYENTKNGIDYLKLISLMDQKGYDESDVMAFLYGLLELGFLHIEMEPNLMDDNIQVLQNFLEISLNDDNQRALLKSIFFSIEKLNAVKCKTGPDLYLDIQNKMDKLLSLGTNKPFIHVDTLLNASSNTLDRKRKISLTKAVDILLKVGKRRAPDNLKSFKDAFFERYETEPIRLVDALDIDYGLGYPVGLKNSGIELGDNFYWTDNKKVDEQKDLNSPSIQYELDKLLWGNHGKRIVEIPGNVLDLLESKEKYLSPTFCIFGEFLDEENNELLYIPGIAGGTAIRTIGRFTRIDDNIDEILSNVISFEENILNDKVPMEVLHNPGGVVGNVVARPAFRQHSMTYLDGDSETKGNVELQNLYISITNDELIITSGLGGKQIIPYLSTAHNTENSPNPIYRFLGDFQESYGCLSISFSWGMLDRPGFYPRAVYGNLILCKAIWVFDTADLKTISNWKELQDWADNQGIDKKVNLMDFDNLLIIDFNKNISFDLMQNHWKNNSKIRLEEIIAPDRKIIHSHEGKTINSEFIFMFKNLGYE